MKNKIKKKSLRKRIKKRLTSVLSLSLVFFMTASPTSTILMAVAETEFVQDLGVIGDNLIYLAKQISPLHIHAEETSPDSAGGNSCSCDFSGIWGAFEDVDTEMAELESNIGAVDDKVDALSTEVESQYENLNNKIDDGFSNLNTELDNMHEELSTELDNLQDDLNSEFDSLNSEMNSEFDSLNTEMNSEFDYTNGIVTEGFTSMSQLITASTNAILTKGDDVIKAINENGEELRILINERALDLWQAMADYFSYDAPPEDGTDDTSLDDGSEGSSTESTDEDSGSSNNKDKPDYGAYGGVGGMTITQWVAKVDGTLLEHFKKIEDQLDEVNENLTNINQNIDDMQHAYRVANIRCINSSDPEMLWKPTLDEIPYAAEIAYNTVGYASVYTGFWGADAYEGNGNLSYTSRDNIQPIVFGNLTASTMSDDMIRAINVLGRDIVISSEGYLVSGTLEDGYSTLYTKKYISSDAVSWSDVINVMYKALGQYKITYTAYAVPDESVTAETSPLAQSLSNITKFDTSLADFRIFFSRSNWLEQVAQNDGSVKVKLHDYYWEKALADGLVTQGQDKNASIYGVDFIKLISKMMHLYGEPVMSQNEVDQLLQVYGLEFPIQMGLDIADAWAYLKVRGVLNDYVDYTGTVNAEVLLKTAMCVKDKDSRTDYKNINISMDLADVLISDGYYPVEDLSFSKGGFSVQDLFDYTLTTSYDYFIALTDEEIGSYKGNYTPSKEGGIPTDWYVMAETGTGAADDASFIKVMKDSNGQQYLHLKVDKRTERDITLAVIGSTSQDVTITIPASELGGGVYTSFTTMENKDGVYVLREGRLSFDQIGSSESDTEWIHYVDALRAGDTSLLALREDATIFETLAYAWDYWTTPMDVNAADLSGDENNSVVTVTFKDEDFNEDKKYSCTDESSLPLLLTRAMYFTNSKWISVIDTYSETAFTSLVKGCYYRMENPNGTAKRKDIIKILKEEDDHTYSLHGALVGYSGYKFKAADGTETFSDLKGATSHLVSDETYKAAKESLYKDLPKIYQLLKNGGVTHIQRSRGVNQWELTYTREDDDATGNLTRFNIIKEIFGKEVNNVDTTTGEPLTQEAAADINISMASSAVMNREENILIAWDDLKTCNLVRDTFNGEMPSPKDDGVYYLQTELGQVKVNPASYTILIGTTLYNLARPDGSGPQLVYVDYDQNMIYFDYRCIMGLNTYGLKREGSTVTMEDNSIGSGKGVIYSLSDSGINSSIMETEPILVYNYPDIYDDHNGSLMQRPLEVHQITDTKFDKNELKDPQNVLESTAYNEDGKLKRIALSSFFPTANWITIIDDTGDSPKGKLFVWYLKHAFSNEDKPVKNSKGTADNPNAGFEGASAYSTAPKYGEDGSEDLNELLKAYIDNKSINSLKWYEQMTVEAAYQLYIMSSGGFALSPDMVLRSFEITDNIAVSCNNEWRVKDDGTVESINANEPGAIYWLDGIGYVYNVPTLEEFTYEKYLQGIYPLPLVYLSKNESGKTDDFILNVNPDYYKTINYGEESEYSRFGYVPGSMGICDVYTIGDDNNKLGVVIPHDDTSLSEYYVKESEQGSVNHKELYSPTDIIIAPSGMYAYFGGDNLDYTTPDALGAFETNSNYVFLGSQRITYNPLSSATEKSFYRSSSKLAPIEFTTQGSKFFEVYYTPTYRVYVCSQANLDVGSAGNIKNIEITDIESNTYKDWLSGNNPLDRVINAIDKGSTVWINICFYILPMIGIIIMTILIGLAFIADTKLVKMLFSRTVDPILILTFGKRDVNTWHWKTCLIPCMLLYTSFAVILNGNLFRIMQWVMKWVGVLSDTLMPFIQ